MRDTWLRQMPQLTAQLGRQHGSETWRARTAAGAEVVARRVVLPAAMAPDVYADRLRRVHEAQAQHLALLCGAMEHDGGVWVLFRPMAAVPLRRLLGMLDPARGLSLGLGVLSGLASLHRAGLGQTADATSVQVDTMGVARLDGTWLPVEAALARSQVREAGRLLCQLLGVSEQPTSTLSAAERQTPGLAAAVRGMAAGSIEDAGSALALLVDAAGGLSAEAQLQRSQSQLADLVRQLVGGREIEVPQPEVGRLELPPPAVRQPAAPLTGTGRPAVTPPAVAPPMPPPPAAPRPPGPSFFDPGMSAAAPRSAGKAAPVRIGPRPSRESTWRARPPQREARRGLHPGVLVAGGLVALVLVVVMIGALRGPGGPRPAPTPPAGSAAASAQPSTAPTAAPSTSTLPASAGDVKQVELAFDQPSPCSPGDRACQLRVQVDTNSLPAAETLAWVFQVTNLCTGKTVQVPGGSIDAGKGWTYAWSVSVISIPQGNRLQIVAQTTQPAVAGSPPLVIGAQSC